MKGTLRKTETGWQVEYQVINSFRFLPINPHLEKYYFLDEDADGGEVEFQIEEIWETGFEDQVLKVATLKRKYRSETVQRLLDEMEKDPWYVKLRLWWNLKVWTYKCLTRKYWDKDYQHYIFKRNKKG